MKGLMRQRGSAWELRVYLGVDPVSGKQRYATKSVRGGKRDAQRVLNEMVVDADVDPKLPSVASLADVALHGTSQTPEE